MAVKIGVISDTHGVLRKEVEAVLQTCDYIIHAGDLDDPETLDQLQNLGELYVVRGNNDWWARALMDRLRFTIEGVRFFLTHDRRDISPVLSDRDVVIFGHSHRYFEEWTDGVLLLNPGSCGRRRFGLGLSMAILYIEPSGIRVEKIEIEP